MNDALRSEVIRRWYGEQSMRQIAHQLHLSRKTVAKIIAQHQQQREKGTTGLPSPRAKRGSQVDSYDAALRDYLARYPGMSSVRLMEELRRLGYKGGYTILRQRVRQLRQQSRRPPVERFETGPGLQAQMDWAVYTVDFTQEGRRKVNLFSYVLSPPLCGTRNWSVGAFGDLKKQPPHFQKSNFVGSICETISAVTSRFSAASRPNPASTDSLSISHPTKPRPKR